MCMIVMEMRNDYDKSKHQLHFLHSFHLFLCPAILVKYQYLREFVFIDSQVESLLLWRPVRLVCLLHRQLFVDLEQSNTDLGWIFRPGRQITAITYSCPDFQLCGTHVYRDGERVASQSHRYSVSLGDWSWTGKSHHNQFKSIDSCHSTQVRSEKSVYDRWKPTSDRNNTHPKSHRAWEPTTLPK